MSLAFRFGHVRDCFHVNTQAKTGWSIASNPPGEVFVLLLRWSCSCSRKGSALVLLACFYILTGCWRLAGCFSGSTPAVRLRCLLSPGAGGRFNAWKKRRSWWVGGWCSLVTIGQTESFKVQQRWSCSTKQFTTSDGDFTHVSLTLSCVDGDDHDGNICFCYVRGDTRYTTPPALLLSRNQNGNSSWLNFHIANLAATLSNWKNTGWCHEAHFFFNFCWAFFCPELTFVPLATDGDCILIFVLYYIFYNICFVNASESFRVKQTFNIKMATE